MPGQGNPKIFKVCLVVFRHYALMGFCKMERVMIFEIFKSRKYI